MLPVHERHICEVCAFHELIRAWNALVSARTLTFLLLRLAVSEVQQVDVLSPTWSVATDGLKVDDESLMLIFLNIARDPSVVLPSSGERLLTIASQFASALHPHGSLAIAMDSTASFDMNHIKSKCLSPALLLALSDRLHKRAAAF